MAISDREINAISDSITIQMRAILDDHTKEMHKANAEARAVMFESGTGFAWDRRSEFRDTIQWAAGQKESHTRRKVMFWGLLSTLGITQAWDHIMGVFK